MESIADPVNAFGMCNGLMNRSVKIVLADNTIIVDFDSRSIAFSGCNVQIHGKQTSMEEIVKAAMSGENDAVAGRPAIEFPKDAP